MTEAERRELLCLMREDPILSESIDELVLAAKRRAVARRAEITHHAGLLSSYPFSPAVAAEAIYKIGLFLNRMRQEKPVHYEKVERWMKRQRQPKGGTHGQQTATPKTIL